jgi:hypothetical protein
MVAMEREQFGDYRNIIRQQFTRHQTKSKHYAVDFMCILHLLYLLPHLFNTIRKYSGHIQ